METYDNFDRYICRKEENFSLVTSMPTEICLKRSGNTKCCGVGVCAVLEGFYCITTDTWVDTYYH